MTHNQLQSACHLWMWNTYPELRMLFHANINNLTTETGDARIKMAKLKHMGLVAGVLDYEFFYRGVLYFFDFKIGADHLSPAQLSFIQTVENQGGKCFEVRSIDFFQKIIENIVGY
jgi:hypothetical protein